MERSHWATKDFVNTELFKLIDNLLIDKEINLDERQHLAFEQNLTFANQMKDIHDVVVDEDDRIIIQSNAFNVLGAYGPIPNIYNELFLDESRNRNFSIKDFLDIFHHKLLGLAYLVYKQNAPEHTRKMLTCFSPISLENLSSNQYFFERNRTSLGITELVQRFLSLKVTSYSFAGDFVYPVMSSCNKLGQKYVTLSHNALLGRRFYDHGMYSIVLLEAVEFERFIDIWKNKLAKLKDVCKSYLPVMTLIKLRFCIKPFRAKKTPLSKGVFLSINAVLASQEKNVDGFAITL